LTTLKAPYTKTTQILTNPPSVTTGLKNFQIREDFRLKSGSEKERTGWRDPSPYERQKVSGFAGFDMVASTGLVYKDTGVVRERTDYVGAEDLAGYSHPSLPPYNLKLKGRAINEALSSLRETDVNLGVAFGERRETAKFVADTLQYAGQVAQAVRKKNLREVKNLLLGRRKSQRTRHESLREVLDAPASLVLKNSYALSPLVNDMYGVTEALNEKDLENPERYGVIGKGVTVEDVNNSDTIEGIYGSVYIPFLVRQRGFMGCVVRIDAFIENPLLHSLASLGVIDPLLIAWELVPFSFVIDWGYPLGDYFDARGATPGLSFKAGSVSQFTRVKNDVIVHPSKRPRSGSKYFEVSTSHYCYIRQTGSEAIRLDRTVLHEFPAAVVPSFENPFRQSRVTNALALAAKLWPR
jgi:hypothetical protein